MTTSLPTTLHAQVVVSYNVENILESLDDEFHNIDGVIDWIEQNAQEDITQCASTFAIVGEDGQEFATHPSTDQP